MALDRSEICSRKYTAEAACWADTVNRCFWRKVDGSKGICLSADYAEVREKDELDVAGWGTSRQLGSHYSAVLLAPFIISLTLDLNNRVDAGQGSRV